MNSHAAVPTRRSQIRQGCLVGRHTVPAAVVAPNSAGRTLAGHSIIVLMILGAVSLFTLVPVICLWLASMVTTTQTSGILLALVAVPVMMVLFGSQMARLDALHAKVTRRPASKRVAAAHRRGLTDTNSGRPTTVLERVMVVSVMIAGAMYLAWFFFFAGSPLPS